MIVFVTDGETVELASNHRSNCCMEPGTRPACVPETLPAFPPLPEQE